MSTIDYLSRHAQTAPPSHRHLWGFSHHLRGSRTKDQLSLKDKRLGFVAYAIYKTYEIYKIYKYTNYTKSLNIQSIQHIQIYKYIKDI